MPHPFGVAVFQNWLYWTDWSDSSLNRMDRLTGENREVLLSNLDNRPMDIHVYHKNRSIGGKKEGAPINKSLPHIGLLVNSGVSLVFVLELSSFTTCSKIANVYIL